MKQNLQKRYQQLVKSSQKLFKRHPYFIPVIGLIAGFIVVMGILIFSGGQTVGADDSYIVNVTIDGKNVVVKFLKDVPRIASDYLLRCYID